MGRKIDRYFSFRWMVSPTLIKIMYFVGVVVITLGPVLNLARGLTPSTFGVLLVALVLGNVIWRVICEALILAFSIHEILASIEDKLSEGEEEEEEERIEIT